MCEVFGKLVKVQLEVSGKRFIIIHGTDINSNISGWTDTRHDHQETDMSRHRRIHVGYTVYSVSLAPHRHHL